MVRKEAWHRSSLECSILNYKEGNVPNIKCHIFHCSWHEVLLNEHFKISPTFILLLTYRPIILSLSKHSHYPKHCKNCYCCPCHSLTQLLSPIDRWNLWNPFNRIRIIMGKFGCTQIWTSSRWTCSSRYPADFPTEFYDICYQTQLKIARIVKVASHKHIW